MNTPSFSTRLAWLGALALCWLAPLGLAGQMVSRTGVRPSGLRRADAPDSVTVVANGRYGAGRIHRFFMGNTYRDLWGEPIRVPVLDLERFGGGLKATEEGGGMQTRTLRFASADGRTWVFRPVAKHRLEVAKKFDGTVLMDLFVDGLSGLFPGAPVITPPFLAAIDVPHPTPALVVLPDDDRLGEFREYFGGRLGTIEEHVSDDHDDPGFSGAVEVVDDDELRERMNTRPGRHVDARRQLKARLVDILLGDPDRHHDQWKWGRMSPRDSLLTPIPRDRDQVAATHDGLLLHAARLVKPYLVEFDSTYGPINDAYGLTRDLDERLLSELDWKAWDSLATDVKRAVSDSVIHAALQLLPAAYHPRLGALERTLRARRDRLSAVAASYYRTLSLVASIHATDSADEARIVRDRDGPVLVQLGREGAPWYSRRFVPGETREIRLYLHGGDDRAAVTGAAGPGIALRVIGGGGNNRLVDSTVARTRSGVTRLYDHGETPPERYRPDTAFDRLPWLRANGTLVPPQRDWGTRTVPVVSIGTGRGLGIVPKLGVKHYAYGFRHVPYRRMLAIEGEYSTDTRGFHVLTEGDLRFEQSRLHLGGQAEMSEFEVVQFHGFGNDVAASRDAFYDVHQRQWSLRATAGYAFGTNRDLTLGPVLKYTTTDDAADRFIAEERPYGVGRFGQLGLELRLQHDTRDDPSNPGHGVFVRAAATTFPGIWSARSAFHRVGATASTYLPVPGPKRSVLALRAGGERVFGEFPYYEAAFLGGSRTLRSVRYHRLAGDASLFGTTELRIPVADFPFILPWSTGLIGFAEAGRVFVDGRSPGGWHHAAGAGFWIGVLSPGNSLSVVFTNGRERGLLIGTGVSF